MDQPPDPVEEWRTPGSKWPLANHRKRRARARRKRLEAELYALAVAESAWAMGDRVPTWLLALCGLAISVAIGGIIAWEIA